MSLEKAQEVESDTELREYRGPNHKYVFVHEKGSV